MHTQKKVIIYGGAFNPPTRAHQSILQGLVEQAKVLGADIWVMPSGSRLDKHIDTHDAVRRTYVEALLKSIDTKDVTVRLEASELETSVPTETIATVQRLTKLHPHIEFWWVFGIDSVLTMHAWHEGDWLYDNLAMLIIERDGYDLGELPPHGKMLAIETPVVSSTQVREALQRGVSVTHLVPPEVNAILQV